MAGTVLKRLEIIYEDESCIVINKPAGLAVQGGKGVGVSLDNILAGVWGQRPFLVHRLDKDTSGLILVAKTKAAAACFSGMFDRSGSREWGVGSRDKKENRDRVSGTREKKGVRDRGSGIGDCDLKYRDTTREQYYKSNENPHSPFPIPHSLTKYYIAICKGIPALAEGVISLDLDIRGSVKKSITKYRLLKNYLNGEFSLLELELGTGRMHQIRRHLALTGNPVLGDDKYGDFTLNKKLRKTHKLQKLLLHASRLIIPQTACNPFLDLTAPLPDYFVFCQAGIQTRHPVDLNY